jgi:Peptide N-acetyl-beta-D-glucosaminyl asparaginase amidase A
MDARQQGRVAAAVSVLAISAWAFVATQAPARGGDAQRPMPAATTTESSVDYSWDGLRATSAHLVAAALDPAAAGADPLQVEPRVPRAAGTPCVVELVRDAVIPTMSVFDPNFTYTPPAACPGPWSKVKLVVELSGPRESGQPSSVVSVALVRNAPEGQRMDGALWVGAPQITDDSPVWRMERDVTEYAASLRTPKGGFFTAIFDNDNFDFDGVIQPTGTALLVFYPATAATPAQRVADVVLGVANEPLNSQPSATLRSTFPRNVERVYLDLVAKVMGGGFRSGQTRYWYACAPDDVLARFPYLRNGFAIGDARANTASLLQGCGGGNYREAEVRIDGQLAGLAPVFPWLGSNFSNNFRSTVDAPAPSAQALNFLPFRIDLTPFAARLNDGAEHEVEVRVVGAENAFVSGHLMLYLDKGRTVVAGAVTRNTLVESTPTVTDTLTETTGDEGTSFRVTGQVVTRSVRPFTIEGYVDTSRGRIRSTVIQRNYFLNTVTYDVFTVGEPPAPFNDYDSDFSQKVRLTSAVDRTSRSVLGTTLLREDKLYTGYPLLLDYRQAGSNRSEGDFAFVVVDRFELAVHQARVQRTSQFRRGTPRYTTSLVDIFDGTHDFFDPALGGAGHTNWASSRDYLFTDNVGGCYSAGLTTVAGMLDTRTRGEDCPNGNQLRWWSRPDGTQHPMNGN